MIKGLSKIEYIDYKIKQLANESNELKTAHTWGNWENWRTFTTIDILIKRYEIEKLELEIDILQDSLKVYKAY